MLIGEILRVAMDAIIANKMRSLLTMLGVIIGIAAVITMVALGEGAQRSVEDRLSALGANVLTVRTGRTFFGGVDRGGNSLTVDDAEAIQRDARFVKGVAPEMEGRMQVEYGANNANLSTLGSWPTYFEVNNFQLQDGRFFTMTEDAGRRRVVVVGALAGEQMGLPSTEQLLGETIKIGGVDFEVIGILEEKGGQGWQNPDEGIYIPLSTAQFRVMGSDRLRAISVQATATNAMDNVMAELDQILRREHRIRPGEEADFSIRDQATLLNTVQETTQTFTFLLAGIAGISLIVGGIGIMNIMLVSVTERTREIGLRKSLGARRQDILLQFLIESLVLCMSGGALGLLTGFTGSYLLQRLAGWTLAISPEAVMLAFGFSAAVGIFFGIWPARRAAQLAPIEALRYE